MTINATPMQLQAIQLEATALGVDEVTCRIQQHTGSILHVTLDAGYGTHSFYVYVGGKVRRAGMGETVPA